MTEELTPEQEHALKIARALVDAGIPVFAASPCPRDCKTAGHGRTEYHMPNAWQKIGPSHMQLNRWKPGWALAALCGIKADFIDVDSHHEGAEASVKELKATGQWPRVFGVASTPSGGRHEMISRLHEREANGFMPGLDYQGGDDSGEGRSIVWIAPTVKRSKNPADKGALGTYSWIVEPDLEMLQEFSSGGDDSGEGVIARLHAHRSTGVNAAEMPHAPAEDPTPEGDRFVTSSEVSMKATAGVGRRFTTESAWEFVQPALKRLREARIGEIEPAANTAAAMLSHFVPEFMTADQAFSILLGELKHTAYDPNRVEAGWTADKFVPVLDGRRPPLDDWKAGKVEPDSFAGKAAEQATSHDDVDALIGRMYTAEQMAERPPPEPLVWDLLDRDSLASLVGLPGSFKSFVALDLAGHIGRGLEWHGHRVHQGLVVYIAAEGERGMTLRTRAWVKKNGPMENVLFLPEPVQVGDPRAWDTLVKACARLKPVFVVVDTQSMVTLGMEENSNTEMNVAMGAFRRIQHTSKSCVLAVHHTKKDGNGVRGGGAQEGAHDTRIRLTRAEPRRLMKVKLKDEKQKDMAESEGFVTLAMEVIDLGRDPHTERVLSSLVVQEKDAFIEASGEEDPELNVEPWRGKSPEPWTGKVVAPQAKVKRRILQVLADHAGLTGITESAARKAVTDRWELVSESGWVDAWQAIKDLEITTPGSSPARLALDLVALERIG
jgi:hypothetical protein